MGEVGGGALMARACLINKINSRAREPTDVYVWERWVDVGGGGGTDGVSVLKDDQL